MAKALTPKKTVTTRKRTPQVNKAADTCGICRFYLSSTLRGLSTSSCRRYPVDMPTSDLSWCGEFSPLKGKPQND